jgi:hypothetical protein
VEENKIVEKRIVDSEDPVNEVTSINIGADGTTNIQKTGDQVVEEERVVEERVVDEHEHRHA